jgi:hypothetical protein
VSLSARLILIVLPFEITIVVFTLFHALLPFVPTSEIPEIDMLLVGLS